MCASCGAFLRRVVWFCALCAVRATAGSMPKSSGSMPTSVGSMPKSVKAVMKAAQARVNEAHDQIKHQTDLWNCKEDLEHFSSKWSPEKQKYCCDLGMGCRGQSGSAADGGGDAVAQGLETHEGAGDAAAHGLGTHGGDAAAHGLDTHGGDAVAHGLDTHGGPGSSEGAKESTPDSTKEDNSRTLAVEVGKPFAEKVEHESMIGTTYEAMAGSGEVWPSWLQFDPVQGRLYGIPAAVSKPMSIEVAKTIFAGGEFNHDTFRYKLVVVPAGAESTTLRTSTVASTTDAVTGAAPSMLGISSPAATPGAAAGGTAQGDSQASGHQSTGEAATTPGISSSSSAPTHSAAAGETAQGTSPASGDASTGAAATMPGISSSAATAGAAAGGTAQGSSPASGDASTGEATSSAADTPGAAAGGTAQGNSPASGDASTGAEASMPGISSSAATPGAAAGRTAQGTSQASGDALTAAAATMPGIRSSAVTPGAAAGGTAQGTSPASGVASTGAAATMPGISSSAATPGAAAGGTAQGSSPASGDASTGEATSSAAATPGAGAGGTAQGTSQDSGDALTGAAATMPGISSSAATGAAAGGTSQRSSPASGDASTGAEASMPGISSSAATPGAAAGGTAQGTSQASGDALTAAAATMPGIRSSAGTPGAAAGGTAQGTSPAFGDVSTGAATTVLDISSSAATPGSAAGGTAQGSSPASGDALTGAAATMLGISSSAATAVAAAGGTAQATSEASGASGSTNGAGSSIAAASNLGVQAAAQSTTGAPAGPTTSMVKFVPSDKEKAIAEELIQHEVPDKAASLGSVGNLPGPNFGGCIIQDAMCEPLDMNWSLEELGREAEDAEDCQQQCRDKVNCACFTYYAQLKACHFASAMSNVRKNAPGFVGGKAYCDEALQGLRAHTVTQIIRKRKCMSDVSFLQPMCTIAAPTTFLDDPVDCQHRCQDHDWCSSFAYNTLTKSCDLQCANATPIHAPVYAMSGPKICSLSLVLGMTLTCPWNFDYEAEKWAQVLVSGLVHAVAKIRTLGGSRANALTAQDVGVSMDKPEDSADNSRSYQLRFDVNEHLAMYLYSLLKSKSTGSKFNEYTENFTSNAAETVLKSQCRPKVSFDFVKKHVEGASFQKLAPLGQSLHLMNHSVQQYSARKAEPAEGAKFDWLLMTVGSFMAVLAIWMLPRWWVQFSKGQCVPSCDPCPEVDVRQAQVGVPLVDEVGVPLVDDEDREPSEEELRPQVMPIVQETDFLMV